MAENPSSRPGSAADDPLDDVSIRERQLQQHLLRSPEYLRKADQELKRQVTLLYLAIALLLVFQGLFAWRTAGQIPMGLMVLTVATSLLAVVNCVLLIRTKNCLRRLNDAWLKPEERSALEALRSRRTEILSRPGGPDTRGGR